MLRNVKKWLTVQIFYGKGNQTLFPTPPIPTKESRDYLPTIQGLTINVLGLPIMPVNGSKQ